MCSQIMFCLMYFFIKLVTLFLIHITCWNVFRIIFQISCLNDQKNVRTWIENIWNAINLDVCPKFLFIFSFSMSKYVGSRVFLQLINL